MKSKALIMRGTFQNPCSHIHTPVHLNDLPEEVVKVNHDTLAMLHVMLNIICWILNYEMTTSIVRKSTLVTEQIQFYTLLLFYYLVMLNHKMIYT